jgi:hypothetical protein
MRTSCRMTWSMVADITQRGPISTDAAGMDASRSEEAHGAQVLVELVITRDSGEIETFNAYRVQHDNRCSSCVQTVSRPMRMLKRNPIAQANEA